MSISSMSSLNLRQRSVDATDGFTVMQETHLLRSSPVSLLVKNRNGALLAAVSALTDA
jgi:hypothetical protein